MMKNFKDRIVHIPLECLISIPDENEDVYINATVNLPPNIRKMLSSPNTGAYITGLTKHHSIPKEKSSLISFFLLQIAIGEKTLTQLPAMLSTELKIPNDSAQKIAQEIEKDLFAPVALELNNYLAKKKQAAKPKSPTQGIGNIVNLKGNPKPNKPFPLPPRK